MNWMFDVTIYNPENDQESSRSFSFKGTEEQADTLLSELTEIMGSMGLEVSGGFSEANNGEAHDGDGL
jgi:hypothetical protein